MPLPTDANPGILAGSGAKLVLRDVSMQYGSVRALDQVSLVIERGEFFTLLGPSGSGKTTLLMLLAGFQSASAGEIVVDGQVANDIPPSRRNFGLVFQHYALFPHMTVFGNIAFPLRARRVPNEEIRRRVAEALSLVRLDGFEERYPRQLSGGQQQRVALARAFVFNPRVLLMDEPLGALDRKLRQEMQIELRQLHRKLGVTVVFVSHDQEEALTMSDRVAVLRNGRLEQVGTPRELYAEPATPFVADFIGESNFFRGQVRTVEAGRTLVELANGSLVPAAAASARAGDPILVTVRPEHVSVASEAERPFLEGRIAEIIYLGANTKVMVQGGAGPVSLLVPAQDQARFKVGDPIGLRWRPEAAKVHRAE